MSFKVETALLFVFLLFGIPTLWFYFDLGGEAPEPRWMTRVRRESDLFVRGEIHYLSMDSGMSRCWNDTAKRFLQLACPIMADDKGTLEIELAVFITSCFCESVGSVGLICLSRNAADEDREYQDALTQCAQEKCVNSYGYDAFETVVSRMPDLCYYYEEEAKVNPEMKRYIDLNELEELKSQVNGESGEKTRFNTLETLVLNEIRDRKNEFKSRLYDYFEEFLLKLDDIKFRLRLGEYADAPYY